MNVSPPRDPKIITFQQAAALITKARGKGLSTVLAQGVFDIIHIGHTTFLKDAKRQGDVLFVGVEPDESVRLNKGSARPFNPLNESLQLIADLQCVDYVFGFEEVIPYGASQLYKPRLQFLHPDKLALPLNDPRLDRRKKNALDIGIQPIVASSSWREYSTTKLLGQIRGRTQA